MTQNYLSSYAIRNIEMKAARNYQTPLVMAAAGVPG
jgi:hypothetical protein